MKQVVLLKLSGEAMSKVDGIGIDMEKVKTIALEIKDLIDTDISLGIVVGAGNIWRGRDAEAIGMDRVSADQMGMLGTVLNAMALAGALETIGVKTRVMTSMQIGNMTEPFHRNHAKYALQHDEVVIFGGGTGSPFFSTDTTAALRAAEIGAKTILMAKNGTDGVYDSDPKVNPSAKKYDQVSIQEVIDKKLAVVDLTASVMCMENHIPMYVFGLGETNSIVNAVNGQFNGTVVTVD